MLLITDSYKELNWRDSLSAKIQLDIFNDLVRTLNYRMCITRACYISKGTEK
jgi:hypothetical protein